jgi:hypothetical protein
LPRESVVRTSMTQFVFSWDTYPNVDFTKCKRVVNLFEDTGSVRELNYLAKISRSCFSPLQNNNPAQLPSLFEHKLQKLNIFLLRNNVTFLRQFFASVFSHDK